MWLYYVAGASVVGGVGAWLLGSKKKAKPTMAAAAPAPALLAATGLPLVVAPIQPAGIPQPRGIVSLPAPPPMTDALHTSAQNLVTYLARGTPSRSSVPEVKAFQTQYNMSGPSTPLKADGIYGPKCQAALQSVMGSAPAPAQIFPTAAVAAPPAIPAAKPIAGVDVTAAANILASMKGPMPKASDSRVSTFQNAYNQSAAVHILADGKYGGSTQGALQSVLDWMGTGGTAPANPFGLAVQKPKTPFSATPPGAPVIGGLQTLLADTQPRSWLQQTALSLAGQ